MCREEGRGSGGRWQGCASVAAGRQTVLVQEPAEVLGRGVGGVVSRGGIGGEDRTRGSDDLSNGFAQLLRR